MNTINAEQYSLKMTQEFSHNMDVLPYLHILEQFCDTIRQMSRLYDLLQDFEEENDDNDDDEEDTLHLFLLSLELF
jgi:hypothetical protein